MKRQTKETLKMWAYTAAVLSVMVSMIWWSKASLDARNAAIVAAIERCSR